VRRLVDEALGEERPRTLPFAAPDATAKPRIAAVTEHDLGGGRRVLDADALAAARAGLWLLFDHMDEAHTLAQDLETAEGSYWHAIVHRREPDAGNARYWFAQVGSHPIFPELLADARALAGDRPPGALRGLLAEERWRPERFVALTTTERDPDVGAILLAIQRREWALLFERCVTGAFGT
jgi:hypothetical protein